MARPAFHRPARPVVPFGRKPLIGAPPPAAPRIVGYRPSDDVIRQQWQAEGRTLGAPAMFEATAPPSSTTVIDTDPGVMAARGNEVTGVAELDRSLDEARRRAVIEWGDPGLAGVAGFQLDPAASVFAKQNQHSHLARLNRALALRKQAVINRLAGRGLLNSGETGYGLGQEDLAYGQDRYDAQNRLLDALRGYTNENLAGKRSLRQMVAEAIIGAGRNYDEYAEGPLAAIPGWQPFVPAAAHTVAAPYRPKKAKCW